MKTFSTILISLFSVNMLLAQDFVQDSVSMGSAYTNSVFYKLDDGNESVVSNTDWDLAFDVSGFGTAIRINGQAGVNLWVYPDGDTADWASLDTTGMATNWQQLNNSDTIWDYGAFDAAAGSNMFDVGWGLYNLQTHHIIGTRLFVLQLKNGTFQKVWIKSMIGGVFEFRHANLDGSMDMTHTLNKADFTDKNFGYFSLENHSSLDREPARDDWDLVFQKYMGDLGGGNYYGVTGVLTNAGVYAAEARGVAVETADYSDFESDSLINTIGYDWKDFDMQLFEFVLEEELSYFVSDRAGNIWHIAFTGFDGSSTGNVNFSKKLVSAVSVEEQPQQLNAAVYPNPSENGLVNMVFNLEEEEAIAQVFDMSGRMLQEQIFQGRGFKERTWNLQELTAGSYFLRITTDKTITSKQIILK